MSAELSAVSGVAPSAAALRVLHVHGRAEAGDARALAGYERSLGWDAAVCGVRHAPRRLRETAADVVALHGRAAGVLGRLLLRGSRTTVLLPRPGSWGHGRGPRAAVRIAWERCAAGWANAVLVTEPAEAAAGVRRRVWVPPFVVGRSLEVRAAVLTRAQAYGRPSGRVR